MRSIKFNKSISSLGSWNAAVRLMAVYLESPCKADSLLESLPFPAGSSERARAQSLFLGALRHGHRTMHLLDQLIKKKPRPLTEAILLISGFELFDSTSERQAKIIHHAVGQAKQWASQAESGLVNAVLRKLPGALESIDTDDLAAHLSHPSWLVQHWQKQFGQTATRALLEWNQNIPVNHIEIPGDRIPEDLQKTQWPGFYRLPAGGITTAIAQLLDSGQAYIKDPSTRIAPELLAPKPGHSVLDFCAAPGGKAFDMARLMQGSGKIFAVDLPGSRIGRLKENLARLQSADLQTDIIECDGLALDKVRLPDLFDAVMLDAPCSNSGVIQRRTDVKWRLDRNDFEKCAHLQSQLLHSAARFVRPGGRIVYSTCSIEASENRLIVENFLGSKAGQSFSLLKSAMSYPWETGHDGAGACLLQRIA